MQPWGRVGLQAEPFPFAATKIRIGRGESLQKAAPAQKPPRSTVSRNENKHKNSIFVNPGLTLGRVPKMRSRKGI